MTNLRDEFVWALLLCTVVLSVCVGDPPSSWSPEFWHYFNYLVAFCPRKGKFLSLCVCECVMWMCECVLGRRCGACSRTPTSLPPRAQWSCPGLPTGCCPALMPSSTFCRHTHLLKIGSAALQKIFWSLKSQWAKSSKVCWRPLRKRPLKDSHKVFLNSGDIWNRLLIRVLDLVWSAIYFNQRLKGLPFTIFILMLILLNDFIILGFSCLLPQLSLILSVMLVPVVLFCFTIGGLETQFLWL